MIDQYPKECIYYERNHLSHPFHSPLPPFIVAMRIVCAAVE